MTAATLEFDLVRRCFTGLGAANDAVLLGVGDDAALIAASACHGNMDTGIASVSDDALADPSAVQRLVGDAAADATGPAQAAAAPAYATLSISAPAADDPRIVRFAALLDAELRERGIALVGGDTTRGPLVARLFVTAG